MLPYPDGAHCPWVKNTSSIFQSRYSTSTGFALVLRFVFVVFVREWTRVYTAQLAVVARHAKVLFACFIHKFECNRKITHPGRSEKARIMWNNNGDSNATMQTEGGYTNLDYTSGGFNNSINGDSSRSSSSKRGQNCVPVMIAHLNRYGEDMAVWGMPVRLVTFVAILDNLEALTTKVSFQFRDETGDCCIPIPHFPMYHGQRGVLMNIKYDF